MQHSCSYCAFRPRPHTLALGAIPGPLRQGCRDGSRALDSLSTCTPHTSTNAHVLTLAILAHVARHGATMATSGHGANWHWSVSAYGSAAPSARLTGSQRSVVMVAGKRVTRTKRLTRAATTGRRRARLAGRLRTRAPMPPQVTHLLTAAPTPHTLQLLPTWPLGPTRRLFHQPTIFGSSPPSTTTALCAASLGLCSPLVLINHSVKTRCPSLFGLKKCDSRVISLLMSSRAL